MYCTYSCYIEFLNIEFELFGVTQVTDVGVAEIARCCPLRWIVLSGLNRLTDHSLFALANSCPYLEEVFINGCVHITTACIRYLLVNP